MDGLMNHDLSEQCQVTTARKSGIELGIPLPCDGPPARPGIMDLGRRRLQKLAEYGQRTGARPEVLADVAPGAATPNGHLALVGEIRAVVVIAARHRLRELQSR